ncbi:hypothetical protein CCU68_05700 [Pseudomonas gingeri NCPPB 3146 = LMG 5327]|uniref:IPT/TIG domain-containing protein n=2 Tax=Pseudomonas gingeri TaxID=117681 RepID=A0A7Y8CCG0_9PSED|nr:hypothetical protein [Pseudomonas gingeri]NWC14230.1 hypothetical protein [Pseudomonas gingeri]NWE45893.1 hypothetical protein [Pseudomonas gingeri]NWE69196.1 hypothetical protein [Pseudomonas gingeri]PNQ93502.1 hypothetical protein CCU68_05700 [Pseudomonas gingeri NCPPB 3146 = LMG 5327]
MFDKTLQDSPKADMPEEAVVGKRVMITGRPVNAFSGIYKLEFRGPETPFFVPIHRSYWDSISFIVPDKLGEHVVEGQYSNGTSVPLEAHIFGTLDIKPA